MLGGAGASLTARDFVAGLERLFLITIGSASSVGSGAFVTAGEAGDGFDESLAPDALLG
jgi:hypothetical protein